MEKPGFALLWLPSFLVWSHHLELSYMEPKFRQQIYAALNLSGSGKLLKSSQAFVSQGGKEVRTYESVLSVMQWAHFHLNYMQENFLLAVIFKTSIQVVNTVANKKNLLLKIAAKLYKSHVSPTCFFLSFLLVLHDIY